MGNWIHDSSTQHGEWLFNWKTGEYRFIPWICHYPVD